MTSSMLSRISTHCLSLLAAASLLTACESEGNEGESQPGSSALAGVLGGRLGGSVAHDSTALSAAPAATGEQDRIRSADKVRARTATGEVLGEAAVESDGSYAFDELPETAETVTVEALVDGDVVGAVLVPGGTENGGGVALPINVETTAEAEAFAALVAGGRAAAEIDAIGLMDRITGAMAITAGTAELAEAAWAGQVAALAGLAAEGVDSGVAAIQQARLAAFVELVAAVEADAGAVDAALAAFDRASIEAMGGSLAAGWEARVNAAAAEAWATQALLEATAAADSARIAAAVAVAAAERAALEAMAAAADAEVAARITAAYDAYEQALGQAADARAAAQAHAALAEALIGDGDSALSALMEAEAAGLAGLDDLPGVSEATQEAVSEALRAANQAMLEAGEAMAEAMTALEAAGETVAEAAPEAAAAFADVRAQLEQRLSQNLAALPAEMHPLVVELGVAAQGNAAAFLDATSSD